MSHSGSRSYMSYLDKRHERELQKVQDKVDEAFKDNERLLDEIQEKDFKISAKNQKIRELTETQHAAKLECDEAIRRCMELEKEFNALKASLAPKDERITKTKLYFSSLKFIGLSISLLTSIYVIRKTF